MAAAKKPAASKPAAKKKESTSKAVVAWDEELAKYAEAASEQEANTGGGSMFSVKSGVLSFQDAPLPNNEMAVIILDTIFENTFYEGDYDPDNPSGPLCFALDRNEGDMKPHVIVSDAGFAQNETCEGCENNEFGSADKGKGKACKNTRRLALIPAGNFDSDGMLELFDADHFSKTEIGFMKLPVTSVKGYAGFVKQVAGTLKRPPFGIVTRIYVEPDAKTQFKVHFEVIDKVPNELLEAIMSRRDEAMATIDFPYSVYEEPAPKPARGTRKAPAKKKAARKY